MKLLAITAAALVLSACQTTRYVPISCVTDDQLPTPEQCRSAKLTEKQRLLCEPPKVGESLTGRADRDVQIIGGSAARLRAWGQGLRSVLEGCREK